MNEPTGSISMQKPLSALKEEAFKIQVSLKSPRLKIGGFFVPPDDPGRVVAIRQDRKL
jgi:hypothetical protein